MPEKDGKEVLREIKENEAYKSIPVIVLTTSGNETVINRCYALGANSYIKKPISFDNLLKVVELIKSYWMQTVSLPA
jgi:CheY-like chemotaxis protein